KAEAHALAQLAQLPLRRVRVPRLLFHGGHRDHCWLVQQHLGDGAPRRQPSVRQICDFHVELQGFTGRPAPLQSGAFWRRVASRLDTLPHSAAAEGWRRGCCAVAGRTLRLGVMHGDLAPWNVMVTTNGQLAVFDWETFCAGAPPLLDVIHWLLFRPMLLQQRSPDALFAAVVHGIEGQHLRSVASRLQCDLPLPSLLVLYVVDWITRLEVEQQGKWQPSRARMIARLGRILRAALVVGGMRC
ncbi:MAG TPA: hypothetical protein ENK23_00605, partial [Sorangium sp.]|nr:hypothetical protein [Sorangium sp.]